MRVVADEPATKGSQKWLQRAVIGSSSTFDAAILAHLRGARRIEWLSPRAEDEFAEYRDETFLRLLGLDRLIEDLAEFWPARGPQWDGLAITDANHVLLVEAKAHIGEFVSPRSAASAPSLARIHAALSTCAREIGAKEDAIPEWHRLFYQYTNRLCHLHWLRKHEVDAKLVLVGFVGDEEMPGDTTVAAWAAAYRIAHRLLGIPRHNPLRAHIIHVHPDVSIAA